MKIKWGALVTDGRNKIGGHVASKNRAGAYIRTKVTPVNPQSAAQVGVRAILTQLSRAWSALTEAQRASWNSAVGDYRKTDIFGDLKEPSGFNLFLRLNMNLLNIGIAQINAAPLVGATENFDSITPTIVAATSISIAYVGAGVTAGSTVVVEATPPVSPGQKFVKNKFRKIGTFAGGTATPYVATTAYENKFGSIPPAGQQVFFRFKCINKATGQAGQPVQGSDISA